MTNILKCKKCGDIITSDERHDMNWCKCGAIAIDGGDDYCKITGNPEDMDVFVPSPIFKNLQAEQIKEMQEHQEAMLLADRTIKELEAKLAESDAYKLRIELAGADETIQQLKQQLAESEKENMELASKVDLLESEKENLFRTLEEANEEYQDKISFALEQLEMAKEKIMKTPITDYDLSGNFEKMYKQDAIRQIDNQIKAIKEMK